MPDTKPTPTVIAQALTATDIALARKWYRCGCGMTYETIMASGAPDGDHRHVADEVKGMAAEIAAAREAWGVPREAVAGLVEAAERMVTCRPTENLATLFALRAALEHVQGGGA